MQIISACLSRYYCFAKPESIMWIFWYVREASTGVIVANIPHLYALLRQVLHLEAFGSLKERVTRRAGYTQHPLSTMKTDAGPQDSYRSFRKNLSRSESTERIAPKHGMSLEIWQKKEYTVTSSEAPEPRWADGDSGKTFTGSAGSDMPRNKATVVSTLNSHEANSESV